MRLEFGARLIKTAAATTLAVLATTWIFGDHYAAIFAGLAAFASVSPNLQQSWRKAGQTILANLVGGLWAAIVISIFSGSIAAQVAQVLLAIMIGLVIGHNLLPGQENSTLAAILALLAHSLDVEGHIIFALAHRLGIVMLGSLIGFAVNTLYPPRHLIAAQQELQNCLEPLEQFAERILASLSDPFSFEKEDVKRSLESVKHHLDEAVRRLSFVEQENPERRELRWRAQTLYILLDSLAELHRWALYLNGIPEADRAKLAETIDAMLKLLRTPSAQTMEAQSSAWDVLELADQSYRQSKAFYPLQHILFRLLLSRR